jgi:hypothetical protein
MDGGHKSAAVGLCGYRSLRAHHNPKTMRDCHSYMDPSTSALNTSVERMGRLLNSKLNVFTIETTINNRMFDRPLEFLAKNEDDLTAAERAALRALMFTLDKTPAGRAPGHLPARARPPSASRASSPARRRRCTRTRSSAATSNTSSRCRARPTS